LVGSVDGSLHALRLGRAEARLLANVGHLVSQQGLAAGARRIVGVRRDEDVAPNGERLGLQFAGESGRIRVGVNAHVAQVGTEEAF
jgi:hypothetical protein